MLGRPRRNRVSAGIRALVQEHHVRVDDLVLPMFVQAGADSRTPVPSMPGVERFGINLLLEQAAKAHALGIQAIALFPAIDAHLKNSTADESANPDGLLPQCVRALKQRLPSLVVITDVAMDPYSSDGHDGLVRDGQIINDATLPILCRMAVHQAAAGADVVAPSDMMDGRVGAIRRALDDAGYEHVLICSYCTKYASAFYGPFRDALDSAPRGGDKKTYQMSPANGREGLREITSDAQEGADWLMVKPGLPYLDMVGLMRNHTILPIAVYHVSGEYAMLKAAAEKGWLDYDACLLESLISFKRAGADMIFTYGAVDAARLLAR